MVGALLYGAGRDQDLTILNILLLDDVENRFEQQRVSIEQDAIDLLYVCCPEDARRWRTFMGRRLAALQRLPSGRTSENNGNDYGGRVFEFHLIWSLR
jgi:hypothetical protein